MSNELLRDIDKILNYHSNEFRALSIPAQHDIAVIREGVRDAIAPRKNNGADGLQLPKKKRSVAASRVSVKAKNSTVRKVKIR